jgi:molybdopterin converting factor small subunit
VRVLVRLFATLARYLPQDGRDGCASLELPEGGTVADAAAALGIPADLPRIVLVNDHEADDGRRLHAEDVVTLFPPLAGGACRRVIH